MPGHKDWLRKALSDLKMARKGLVGDDELDCVVFHAHQCAEKTLKAYFVFKRLAVERTHDLEFLLKLCREHNAYFSALENDVIRLNPYGMFSRYPDDHFFVKRHEAEEALKIAKKIFEFVCSTIDDSNPTKHLFFE